MKSVRILLCGLCLYEGEEELFEAYTESGEFVGIRCPNCIVSDDIRHVDNAVKPEKTDYTLTGTLVMLPVDKCILDLFGIKKGGKR